MFTDHYKLANEIAIYMEKNSFFEDAEKLRSCISEGFSSTDILMRIRFFLIDFRQKKKLSTFLLSKIDFLLNAIDRSLTE